MCEPATAPSGASFQSELAELEFGRLHRFADWPNSIVPTFGAGVYTIWQGGILVYVGMSGRSIGAETGEPTGHWACSPASGAMLTVAAVGISFVCMSATGSS